MRVGVQSLGVTCRQRPELLVIASTYPRWRGDAEPAFVHELCQRLTERFRIIVVCPHAPGAARTEMLDGVEVVRYRYAPANLESLVNGGGIIANLRRAKWKWLLLPGFFLGQAWCCWKILKRARIAAVHAHWLLPQGLIALLAMALAGARAPLVITAHGSDVNALSGRLAERIKSRIVRSAAVVTTVSEPLRKRLQKLAPGADIRVAPMGVDLKARFAPDGCLRNQNEILMVGRLVAGKGIELVLEALALVRVRVPGVTLTIIGQGPEEDTLRESAAALGLSDSVRFEGPVAQDRLPTFYRRAGVFVAAFGEAEGFGLVLIEAIGCGCPVIANEVPAARFVLGENFPAVAVDCNDSAALAERIVMLLECPSPNDAGGALLRAKLLARFDWTPAAKEYADLFSQLIERAGRQ